MRPYRVTKTAWFGPKRFLGWGWAVTSWRGLLTTALFIALNGAATFWRGPGNRLGFLLAIHGVLIALFFAVVVLTGDAPGGPKSKGRSIR